MKPPTPKVALITGAARRIGADIARYLHSNGFNVIVHYNHSKKAATRLCKELNNQRPQSAVSIQTNLIHTKKLSILIKKSAKKWERLDVLVNNASCFYPTKINKITEENWNDLINTNLKAPFFLAQAAAPYLTKSKGSIINIADIHGERPMRDYPVYSISKAGLLMMTKALARELAPHIRVNAISPGPTIWPEGKNKLNLTMKKIIIDRTLLKKHGDPQAIAKAVYFLIADATDTTGQNLVLDNGRSVPI